MSKHWSDKLVAMNACGEAVRWARTQKSYAVAWKACARGDWMLWLLGRTAGPVDSDSRRKLVGAAAACAELALPIYEARYPNDSRVRDCIETCKRYAAGTATLDEVRKARIGAYAYAADAADAAYAADAAATYAAAYAADAAADDADAAAAAAAYAADAAAYAAAYAADAADARNKTLKQCADVVRKHYPKAPIIGGGS